MASSWPFARLGRSGSTIGPVTERRLGYNCVVSNVSGRRVVFQLFPDDHDPRHVHGHHAGIEVVVDLLTDGTVALSDRTDNIQPNNAKRSDVKKILKAAQEHFDVLVTAWENMHR